MATAHSTRRARSGKPPSVSQKPKKPRPDFPLSWHPAGYWCKKIRGKLHYFGNRYGSAEEAEEHYARVRDDLHAGREPSKKVLRIERQRKGKKFFTQTKSNS